MRRCAGALLAGALLLSGCSAPASAPPANPAQPTIVSLNPCTDAILAEVAAPGQLLAISHYSKDPRSTSMEARVAQGFAATGGTVEEVLALAPDVVVAGSFIPPATRAALENLGIRVVTFGMAGTVAESEAQVRELAALAGDAAAGERLVGRIEAALKAAGSAGGPPVSAVLWQPGGIVPGEAALVSELLERTGFSSLSMMRGMAQADFLALEQVAADPPQVLLVAGSEAGQRHPVLDKLPQVRREHFDTQLLYCGGPTIIRAAHRLAAIRQSVS
ncbi:ABC transporter substrate-binding protein [Qipengyuania marisflavi]|uniref:Iron ABC transporter substrate-binding protein n=1 Tax=Qipengyuania marisflavi TaxID=2486356 RepID=A0A5S3PG47_9SPHN|nr:ABC transporter substrate-binding protein [Qipengyuania marisflavi]TMM50500.1 iron ABC transporter substrate-binding protein [Qipengyuania marisflavi]